MSMATSYHVEDFYTWISQRWFTWD